MNDAFQRASDDYTNEVRTEAASLVEEQGLSPLLALHQAGMIVRARREQRSRQTREARITERLRNATCGCCGRAF